MNEKQELISFLRKSHQEEGIQRVDHMSPAHIHTLYEQLKKYRPSLLSDLKKLTQHPSEPMPFSKLQPVEHVHNSGLKEDTTAGEKLLKQGKVGCLILAGGQASRLNTQLPKALFPVTRFKQKSLMQLFCEKAAAASKKYGKSLPIAVMTSPLNHSLITFFLREKSFFGLSENQLSLFTQNVVPLFDLQGNLIFNKENHLVEGPNGNGEALKRFHEVGLWKQWKESGIEAVLIIPIDNPLADPFDANLCGYLVNSQTDVTIKAMRRKHALEKVGLIVNNQEQVQVVEYIDIPEVVAQSTHEDGSLIWSLAHIGQFCFHMHFIEHIADPKIQLPYHAVQKTIPNEELSASVWKLETFLFDVLKYTKKTQVILYPREEVYSPLKNVVGDGSIQAVQYDLLGWDRKVYEKVTGVNVSQKIFELDPIFYYPTDALMNKWKGHTFADQSYVTDKEMSKGDLKMTTLLK